MNGVDESNIIDSGSCHVSVNANDVGKADVIDSGSGHVLDHKKNISKCDDDGNVAMQLCKKTYVLTDAVPAQDGSQLEAVEGGNLLSHNCINGEAIQIDSSVPFSERMLSEEREIPRRSVGCGERTTPEPMDVRGKSVGETPNLTADVKLGHVYQSIVLADSKSASANSRVLPSNCDPDSINDDRASDQLALSLSSPETELSLSPLSDDVFARTKNGDGAVDGEIILVGKCGRGGGTGQEWQPVNSQLISSELPAVHREGSEAVRHHHLTDCRIISARLISDNLQMVRSESSEADLQRQFGNSNGEGSETDQHQPFKAHSPTVGSEGSESDHLQRFTNSRLNSDNLLNSERVGVETYRNANCQLQIADIRGIEADRQRQQSNRRSPTSHSAFRKRQLVS